VRSDVYIVIPLHVLPLRLKEVLSFPQEDYISKLKDLLGKSFGKKQVIFTSDGRNAIYLALKMMRLNRSDEVLIPGYACYALREAVLRVCTPVYVDVDQRTSNIDAKKIELNITKNTRAIIAPYLYGNPYPVKEVLDIAKANNLMIIEDVAQALGGKYADRLLGSFGDFAVFSFRFTKNIGAFRGGALLANNNLDVSLKLGSSFKAVAGVFLTLAAMKQITVMPAAIYAPLRKRLLFPLFSRNAAKFNVSDEGLSNYQCYLLYRQLGKMGSIIEKRRDNAKYYSERLKDVVTIPAEPGYGGHTYYRYTIQSDRRDMLYDYLLYRGIEADKMYDYSLALDNICPQSAVAARKNLNLPVHHELSSEERENIVRAVCRFSRER